MLLDELINCLMEFRIRNGGEKEVYVSDELNKYAKITSITFVYGNPKGDCVRIGIDEE